MRSPALWMHMHFEFLARGYLDSILSDTSSLSLFNRMHDYDSTVVVPYMLNIQHSFVIFKLSHQDLLLGIGMEVPQNYSNPWLQSN